MRTTATTTLADVCESVRYGYTASATEHAVGPRFLRITDIVPDSLDWESVPYCEIDDEDRERLAVVPGDIVVARTGATVGYAKLIRESVDAVFASYLVRFRVDPAKADPAYVGRLVESSVYKAFIQSRIGGAAQPNASAPVLGSFEFALPPRHSQSRIADILSAYDNLIENNRRRMALLEEAARQLYREWFVCLRFPGYEHIRITNGVPEGWEQRALEQCVSVLETGNRPKGGVSGISEGVPSIGAESIVGVGQFDFSQTKYVPEDYFSKLSKGVIRDRDVLVYKDGGRPGHFTPHVSLFGGGFPFDRMALNSHVYRVRGADPISQEYLYYHLSSEPMMSWMNSAGSGAAIPGIARRDLLRLPVLVAPNRLMELFTEMTATGITQILKLALVNRKLQEARDLLLPRLMRGEIAV